MERLYLSVSRDDKVDFSESNWYEFEDVDLWMPKIAILFQRSKISKNILLDLVNHINKIVLLSQLTEDCVKSFLISIGAFFNRSDLENNERLLLAGFISRLIQSRHLGFIEEQFDNISSLEDLAFWSCQNLSDSKYTLTLASFLASYSQLGHFSVSFLQDKIRNETRTFMIQVFDNSERDKVCAQIQLDILRIMWNIFQVKSSKQTAIIAEKFFKRDSCDNLTTIFQLCRNEINVNSGSINGLISACILVDKFATKIPKDVFEFEKDHEGRGSIILACIRALRNDDDFGSTKKSVIVQLLYKMSLASQELKDLLIGLLSEDEDSSSDSLVLHLISKDSLKHGDLSNWAAKLFLNLDLGDVVSYPQRSDLQNVLMEQLNQTQSSLSKTNHPNITLVHDKLIILIKLTQQGTSPRNTSTQTTSSISDCITELLANLVEIKKPHLAVCWSYCTLLEWLPTDDFDKVSDNKNHMDFLKKSINVLLYSKEIENCRVGLRAARRISEDILQTNDLLWSSVSTSSRKKRQRNVENDKDKENQPVKQVKEEIKEESASKSIVGLDALSSILIERENQLSQLQNLYNMEKDIRQMLEQKISTDETTVKFDSRIVLELTSELSSTKVVMQEVSRELEIEIETSKELSENLTESKINCENLNQEVDQTKYKLQEVSDKLDKSKTRCEKLVQESDMIQKSKETALFELSQVKSELKRERASRKQTEEENGSTMAVLAKLLQKHNSSA